MLSQNDIQQVARAAWNTLQSYSEVQYVYQNSDDPYKPFYRMATILVSDYFGPVGFTTLGLRRHLTEAEALAVVRAAHPYFARILDEDKGPERFLRMFNDFAEMYDPAEWG